MAARIFLAAADLSAEGGATIVRLTHPRTESPFSAARVGDCLLEINRWSDGEPHTWLIAGAERVQREGAFFLASPLDPLFLLLPHLKQLRGGTNEERADGHKGYFRPLGDLVSGAPDEAALETVVLSIPSIADRLRAVCDVKDGYDEPMIRLNDAKVLAWLTRKTEAVRAKLTADEQLRAAAAQREAEMHMSQFDALESADAGENTSSATCALAIALVSEYLAPAYQAQLCEAYAVDQAVITNQRGTPKKASAPIEPASYGGDLGAAGSSGSALSASNRTRDEPQAPPPKKQATVAKSAKLASLPLKKGQKTMMGFFSKPK